MAKDEREEELERDLKPGESLIRDEGAHRGAVPTVNEEAR